MRIIPPTPRFGEAFGSLRAPAFRWWFVSQALSASGSMTQVVAQSWLLLKLTGSGVDLGLLSSCYMLPVLVGGPWAGAIADRFDRRRLLVVTQSLFVGSAALLAGLSWTGSVQVWMLFLISFVTGAVSAPDAAARQVYALDLVGGRRLASAVSLNEVVLNLSRVAGPAVGGLLLATLGVPACFLANALSFLPSLLVLLVLHRQATPAGAGPARIAARPPRAAAGAAGVRAGLRYVWGTPVLRSAVLMAGASGMLFNLGVGLPLLATEVFHLGGGGYGAMMAAFGAGGVAGALAAAARPQPSGPEVRTLAALTGLSIVATALAPDVTLVFAGMAVTGWLSIWFIARANTLAQLCSDPAMRGRVMGIWTMALPGAAPLTAPATGVVAQAAGGRAGFGLAGIALLLSTAAGWRALAEGGAETATQRAQAGTPPLVGEATHLQP